jgi:hypothetical protein
MLAKKTLAIHKTKDGTGTLEPVTGTDLLQQEKNIRAAAVPIYIVEPLPNKKFVAKEISFEDLVKLPVKTLEQECFLLPMGWEKQIPQILTEKSTEPAIDPFAEKISKYTALTKEERAEAIKMLCKKTTELRKAKAPPEEKARGIVEAILETVSINKVALTLASRDTTTFEFTVPDLELSENTLVIEDNILNMVENSDTLKSLFTCFKQLSNGQTLNHCIRTTVMMAGFMRFYKNILQASLIPKLRVIFAQYIPLYKNLFPTLNENRLTSFSLMKLGAVEEKRILLWLHGANFHDIGKLPDVDYFESNAAYDAQMVPGHVKKGKDIFDAFYNNNDFEESSLMVGDHHNAFRKGYSVTSWEGKQTPEICITLDHSEYLAGKALGFLPIEMLAILDIYDALTDTSRTYKKPYSSRAALELMYEKNVLAGKLDPILFDLFVDFLRDAGVAVPEQLGFSVKYARRK